MAVDGQVRALRAQQPLPAGGPPAGAPRATTGPAPIAAGHPAGHPRGNAPSPEHRSYRIPPTPHLPAGRGTARCPPAPPRLHPFGGITAIRVIRGTARAP